MHYFSTFFSLLYNFGLKIALDDLVFRINRRITNKYGESIATFRKYRDIRRYLLKKYSYIIDRYKNIECEHWNGELITSDCPIWLFWAQGFDNAPYIVKECVKSIDKFKNNHPLIYLSNENVRDYADIPDFVIDKYQNGLITPTTLSDILRYALLTKHGGIWLDACTFLIGDSFIKEAENYSFYSVKGTDTAINYSDRLWVIGALACGKGNKYASLMYDLLVEYYKNEQYQIDYFLTSSFEKAAFEKIPAMRDMMFAYPANNQNLFCLRNAFDSDFDADYFQKISSNTDIFNLTWKIEHEPNINSYLSHMIEMNENIK